jgi:hypothetical protein
MMDGADGKTRWADSAGPLFGSGGSCAAREPWLGSRIPACGEQQEHCVIAFEFGFHLAGLKTVRDRLAVRGDFPFPPWGTRCHGHFEHAGAGLLDHSANMRWGRTDPIEFRCHA